MAATGTWTDDLTDKVCVVTGGAGGIGSALAARFLDAGMRVVIADVEQDAITAAVDALGAGDRVLGITHDVRSLEDTQRLRDEILDRFGGVHIVCLNAGVAPVGAMFDTPPEVWEWVFDVNVRGVVHGALDVRTAARRAGSGARGLHRQHRGGDRHPDPPALRAVEARGGRARGGDAARARRERRRCLGALPGAHQHADLRERAQPPRGHGRPVGRQPDVEGVPRA